MNYQSIFTPQYGIDIIFNPNMERARKPIHRGQDWERYKPVSFKSSVRKMIHCESEPESNFVKCLECNSDVEDYCEQPALIKYTLNGQHLKHIPDFLIEDKSELPIFVEIKSTREDIDEEIILRTQFLKKQLPKIGFGYEIVIISEIDKTIAENSLWIYQKGRPVLIDDKPDWFSNLKPLTKWKEFNHQQFPRVAKLILQGFLFIDFSIPISANSFISTYKIGDLKWTN